MTHCTLNLEDYLYCSILYVYSSSVEYNSYGDHNCIIITQLLTALLLIFKQQVSLPLRSW